MLYSLRDIPTSLRKKPHAKHSCAATYKQKPMLQSLSLTAANFAQL